MTTTARHTTRHIAGTTAALLDAVAYGPEWDACEMCGALVDYLFDRVDHRDMTGVRACECCADSADLGYVED
jgi:hypothetical protein